MNIDATHPGLKQVIGKDTFTLRRTTHDLSRIPVVLTLEQTINADVWQEYSVHKWLDCVVMLDVNIIYKSTLHHPLYEMAEMITKENVTVELQPKQIQWDSDDLQKIIKHICDTNNPSDVNNAPKTLYSIALALERVQVKKSNKASLQFQPKEKTDTKHLSICVS